MKKLISLFMTMVVLVLSVNISVYAAKPGVQTLEPGDITESTVIMRGAVTSNSGIRIKEYGFQFVNDGNVSWKKFYAGTDFEYPDPINNDVIECEMKKLKSGKEYCYQFYAVNENGERTIGKSVYFETESDDEEPVITKLSSSEGSSFCEGTEVTFSASAEDNREIDEISIFIDGKVVAKKSAKSVKYTTDELEAGEYEIAAIAWDTARNQSDVEYLTVVVEEEITEVYEEPEREEDEYEYTEDDESEDYDYTDDEDYEQTPGDDNEDDGYYNEDYYKDSYEDTENESEIAGSYISIIDKTEPQISNFKSSAGFNFVEGTSSTFSADIYDETLYSTYMYIDGECVEISYTSYISHTTDELTVGNHIVKLVAEDEAGNISRKSLSITVEEYEEDYEEIYDYNENDAYYDDVYYYEDDDDIKVYMNGEKIYFDVPPQIINDRTMVPMRAVFEAFGADIMWIEDEQRVSARIPRQTTEDFIIDLIIGDDKMFAYYQFFEANGYWIELDSPAVIVDGRTLVPLRAISETLKYDVEWDPDTRTVYIDK